MGLGRHRRGEAPGRNTLFPQQARLIRRCFLSWPSGASVQESESNPEYVSMVSTGGVESVTRADQVTVAFGAQV